jgi:hypothetical protein
VACVALCLRFVELWVRDGKPLPALGYFAAGTLAFAFPFVVDWTKYMGLITNLCSALAGLLAMCALASAALDPKRERAWVALALVLVGGGALAKEDFGLPVAVTAACIAVLTRSWRWAAITAAVAMLFGAAILYNAKVGSDFVSGTPLPTSPYFIDLSPASLAASLATMLLGTDHGKTVVAASVAAVLAAIVVRRDDRALAIRLSALIVIAVSMLGANTIFPNHALGYYAFVPTAMLCATLAVAAYAAFERLHVPR